MVGRGTSWWAGALHGGHGESMWYALLADAVVVVHLGYVAYIVVGQLVILLGAWRRWPWVRNPWFRWTHLAAIAIVASEAVAGIVCPLTLWENQLRQRAGQVVAEETFVARWVHAVLFFELPPQAFTAIYLLFAVFVLATLWLVPPRGRRAAVGQEPVAS